LAIKTISNSSSLIEAIWLRMGEFNGKKKKSILIKMISTEIFINKNIREQ